MASTSTLDVASTHTRDVGTAVRTDIQGLRAIAVSMVLLYHLWPNRLTGGFTGVDVFFVISGFLITSHLLAHPPRRLRDLAQFWSRRIRRLLPASLLVLATTLLASRLIAPDTQWANTANQVKAAALYVVNWRLASDSVDYLAAEASPSPVQHFWSLSVEEQFYFFWPVLILILVAVATVLRWRLLPTVLIGLGGVVVASLAYSVHATSVSPASAYFITPTRMWELGIGGVLAAALSNRTVGRRRDTEAVPLPPAARAALAWAGLATIAWTAFSYTGRTPFPSWQALVPVLGTAAVIAAVAPRSPVSPGPILALRPIQWLGNVSYSVYLWHWPLIALVPYVSGNHLGRLDKAVIIAASLVLAGLTKRYVEDRFRTPKWGRPLVKPFALAAVAMAFVVGCTVVQNTEVQHREQRAATALQTALSGGQPCFGAAAIAAPAGHCPATTNGTLTPSPLQAAKDKPDAYASVSGKRDCFAYFPSFKVIKCTFGDLNSRTNVALVGNSHAGEWLPALEQVAKQQHWKITTYVASECALAFTRQHFDTPAHSQDCLNWAQNVTRLVTTGKFNLVVMENRISVTAVGYNLKDSYAQYAKGYQQVLERLSRARVHVVGLRDTPAPGKSIPDCLAANPQHYNKCNGPRSRWLPPEPLTTAIEAVHDPNIVEADLTRYICPAPVCAAAIGRVPVYFDGSHLTATYAMTLAPYLRPTLVRMMSR
ncbi:MAG: acyltransferase family protein [Jatrophihabitantaceae bacterium]